jgi:hypothetical protein
MLKFIMYAKQLRSNTFSLPEKRQIIRMWITWGPDWEPMVEYDLKED